MSSRDQRGSEEPGIPIIHHNPSDVDNGAQLTIGRLASPQDDAKDREKKSNENKSRVRRGDLKREEKVSNENKSRRTAVTTTSRRTAATASSKTTKATSGTTKTGENKSHASYPISISKSIHQMKYLNAPGENSGKDQISKISHMSRGLGVNGTIDKVLSSEKHQQLQDISKRLKWEEAREKVSKALKNAATPDGLVAINIKRLSYFNTDKIRRLLLKARAADEELTNKRLQAMANDELRTKRAQREGLGRRILAFEKVFLPEREDDEEEEEADEIGQANVESTLTTNLKSSVNTKSSMGTRRSKGTKGTKVSVGLSEARRRRSSGSTRYTGGTGRGTRQRGLEGLSGLKDFAADKNWYETNPRIYFSFRTPLASKTTGVFVLPNGSSTEDLIIDSLVHFTCTINPLKESNENIFTISVVAFMPQDETKHYIVSEKHFYLIDIIRSYCVVDSYKFKSIMGDVLMVEADIEMCFGYGMFGYGYSNQLLNVGKPITEGVARSIFIRSDPGPETEKVKEVKGMENRIKGHAALAPKVTHPTYLDYRNRLEIYDASAVSNKLDCRDKPSETEVAGSTRPPVVTLSYEEDKRVRRMLQATPIAQWTAKFNSITDRRERLVFLKSTVLNEPEVFETHHIKGVKPIDDEPSTLKGDNSKFNEMHNVRIVHVKNMFGLKLKPEKPEK